MHSGRHTENSEHDEKIQAAGLSYLRESQSTCHKLSLLGFLYSHSRVLSQPSGLAGPTAGLVGQAGHPEVPLPNTEVALTLGHVLCLGHRQHKHTKCFFFFFFLINKSILRVFRTKSCRPFQPHRVQSLFTRILHFYSSPTDTY